MNTGWIKQHTPCPDQESCGSSDGYCVDHTGIGYCFSCETPFNDSEQKPLSQAPMDTSINSTSHDSDERVLSDLTYGGSYEAIPERSISKETCEFFGVKTEGNRWVFPYFDEESKLVAQKTRIKNEKVFPWKGLPKKSTLFGMQKFNGGDRITIVEGEFDALAYRDLMGDFPVVSIKNGAQSAAKDVRNNIEYFKKFNYVYVCFDNDEHGRKAAIEVAEVLPMGTVKIVNLRHHKDANDYLKHGHVQEFKRCWWNATEYTPAGIESAKQGGFDSLFEDVDNLELFPYPYDKLNEASFGIRKGEMVTVVAGSGVGKSAFIGETGYKLLMETDKKVGCIFLEESVKKTKLRFMSLFLNKPLHLTLLGRVAERFDFLSKVLSRLFKDDSQWTWDNETKKELSVAWKNVIEKRAHDGEPQLWLFNHFGSNSIDSIVNKIDAMVTGLGCEFIFLDHVSIVVSDQQNADERKALDELATKLRTLVEHRNFALVIVSHLRRPGGKPHEEGGETSLADIRGTAGIGQLSDVVIGLERNGQHDIERMRNITRIRVLKNRFSGITGLTSYAEYSINTGRLEEVDPEEVEYIENSLKEISERDSDDSALFDSTPFGDTMKTQEG